MLPDALRQDATKGERLDKVGRCRRWRAVWYKEVDVRKARGPALHREFRSDGRARGHNNKSARAGQGRVVEAPGLRSSPGVRAQVDEDERGRVLLEVQDCAWERDGLHARRLELDEVALHCPLGVGAQNHEARDA